MPTGTELSSPSDLGLRVSAEPPPAPAETVPLQIALFTGGGDKPYALGLATALSTQGIALDFIGSDDLDLPAFRAIPRLTFLNLRGNQSPSAPPTQKVFRVVRCYARIFRYALTSQAPVFHILWNNRFEWFDRTLLMLFYRATGRRLVLTVHNVNTSQRDGTDSRWNRFTLRIQYRLADHLFAHTRKMKQALMDDFGVPNEKISVIRLGVNNTVPTSELTCADARARLGLSPHDRVLLFFGRISPYKGLEHLISALARLNRPEYRLLIVGSLQGGPDYWNNIQRQITASSLGPRLLQRIEFIPDEDTELYFKAADVLVLPYVQIFQSGVLVLAYSFGLPVLAADVGSLGEEVVTGTTGYVFRPRDPAHLAETITQYFSSPLYRELPARRIAIQEHANRAYSWNEVAAQTEQAYAALVH